MTGAELRAWAAAARPWLPYLAVLVVGALLFRSCNEGRAARAEAKALREAAAAHAAGVVVVEPVPDVRPQLDEALKRNAALKAELARARAAVPSAKPTGVLHAETAGAKPTGTPAPTPCPPAGAPPAAACLLRSTDTLRLAVDGVELTGDSGARLAVGTAEAWRAAAPDAPATMLSRQPWQAAVTTAVEKGPAAPEPPSWGYGPAVGAVAQGGLLGVTVLTPEGQVPLLERKGGLVLTGGGGPGGWGVRA